MLQRDPTSVISDGLKKGLPRLRIANVDIRRDREYDGLPVFMVRVVLDSSVEDVVGAEVNRVTNEIANELVRLGEPAFPIFSFIAQNRPV